MQTDPERPPRKGKIIMPQGGSGTPAAPVPEPLVEVVRSFAYKKNLGNYESVDFFCSRKEQCRAVDADRVADALHAWCRDQVRKAVRAYNEEGRRRRADDDERYDPPY